MYLHNLKNTIITLPSKRTCSTHDKERLILENGALKLASHSQNEIPFNFNYQHQLILLLHSHLHHHLSCTLSNLMIVNIVQFNSIKFIILINKNLLIWLKSSKYFCFFNKKIYFR